MKKLILFMLFSCLAYGQGVRFGDQSPVQQVKNVPGVATNLLSPVQASISFCGFPANAVPCTNKVTTYTDSTLATPCSTSTQVTLSGSSSCVANTDTYGNWGVWVPAGSYCYTTTVNGASAGPTCVVLGGSGTSPKTSLVANLPTSPTPSQGTIYQALDGQRGQYTYNPSFWHPVSTDINVQDFGARGDGGTYVGNGCTSGSAAISYGVTIGRAPVVGDTMVISGCGAAGADLTCTVASSSGTQFGTASCGGGVTAGATLSNRGGRWGKSVDDTTAFQAAITFCSVTNPNNTANGCRIKVPQGLFFISNLTFPTNGGQVMLQGAGRATSWIFGIGANQTAILIAPANSVSTYVSDLGFQSYDRLNVSQWAIQWQGGTDHTFTNNMATQMYGMVSAANTWFNWIYNNHCYGVYGDCVEFGGAAGTGPVNQTHVTGNQFIDFHGYAFHEHTNSGSWSNTIIGNDTENTDFAYTAVYMLGASNEYFVGGYMETTPLAATSGYDVIINTGGGEYFWHSWPCTQINAASGVAIYGGSSGTNPCSTAPYFFNTVAGVRFYGASRASINSPSTATYYSDREAYIRDGFAFRNAAETANPYKLATLEWGNGVELSMSHAAPNVANPTTPSTPSGATFGSGTISSIVWNKKLNAYNSDIFTNSVLGWVCVAGSPFQCVSNGSGYSSGVWAELGIARLKRVREGTVAPASGAWTTGDRVDNTSPTNTVTNPCTSQFINVSGGSPGTFVNVPCGVNVMKTTITISPTIVAANTCAEQTFAVTGVLTTDLITVNKPTSQAGLGVSGARASSAGNIGINFCNNTGAGITPTASEVYVVGVTR